MAYNFETENAKTLRYAPDFVNITIKVGNETIMTLNKEDLISCVLSLKSVETKLDNPELQASTLELEAYWPGDDEDIAKFRGKNTIIEYQCGYVDGEKSKKRTFYAAFDEDGLKLRNHTLKISATDGVGTITGQNEYTVTRSDWGGTIGNRSWVYVSNIFEKYLKHICNKLSADGQTIFSDNTGCPGYSDWAKCYCDYGGALYGGELHMLIENKSYRKTVAQFCNIFRGSDLTNPDAYAKRFVFRDAGIPVAGWCRSGIGDFAGGTKDNILLWDINYNDVSEFAVTYGNPIKTVSIINPRLGVLDETRSIRSDYVYKTRGAVFIKTEDYISRIDGYGGAGVASVDLLDGKTIKVTFEELANVSKYCDVSYYALYKVDGGRTVTVHSSHAEGDSIRLEELCGLAQLDMYQPSSPAQLKPIQTALEHTLNDCGLANPRWIEFTWRGNPNMQPRDTILFTEKDGTQNYYEIDNLTLEHVDGGLISKVKAIYKYPYQGE